MMSSVTAIHARHRRDLVSKRAKLQCQIRHHLQRCLPGYTTLFPTTDLWDHPIGLMVLRFIAEHGGTHNALLEAGVPGVNKWLKEQRCAFQSRSVERIVALGQRCRHWRSDGSGPDPDLQRRWLIGTRKQAKSCRLNVTWQDCSPGPPGSCCCPIRGINGVCC
ncbi:MAG: hypothetical protein U0941_24950 [Planctomycetaceae bacterium]